MQLRYVALALLSVAVSPAQSPDQSRVFALQQIQTPQQIQEFVNAVRAIGDIPNVAADAGRHTVSVSGTADQLALTAWLLEGLDQPARPQSFTVRDTTFPDPRYPVVKICYPPHFANPQQTQEAINAVRSIAEAQRVAAFNRNGAIVLRATADQAAFAEWLLRNLDDAAAGSADRATRQYTYTDTLLPPERRSPAARIYFPANIRTPLYLQESINALRSITEVQRVVAFTAAAAIVLRGAEQQTDAADWLIGELDQQASGGAHEFTMAGDRLPLLRTFSMPKSAGPQDLRNAVNIVRQSTGMQRVVGVTANNMIVLRGAADQVAQAAELLR